jgi:hypothetical protein
MIGGRVFGMGIVIACWLAGCSTTERSFSDAAGGGAGDDGAEVGAGAEPAGGSSSATGGVGTAASGGVAGLGASGTPGCAADEYAAGASCKKLTVCASDEFEQTPPGPKQDRVCSKASSCGASEYEVSPPSASSDRLCSPLTVCAAGTFVSTPASPTSDQVCKACPPGQFSSGLDAAACAVWSACEAGDIESVPPSATSDRVCSKCGAGKYEQGSACVALSVCSTTQYESTPPTATSDRECADVTSCQPGSKQTAAPTATTDRQCAACSSSTFSTQANATTCKPWTVCSANQKQTMAGTATSDVVCVDKPVCSTAPDRVCSVDCPCASGEGVCTASNQCVSGASCVAGSGKKVGRSGDTCLANHCTNDTKDGSETSVDCGGECGCRATLDTIAVKGLPADRNAFYALAMSRDGKRLAGTLKKGNLSYPGAMTPDGTVTALQGYGQEGYTMAASADGNVLLGLLGCANPPTCSDTAVTIMTWTGAVAPKVAGTSGNPRAISSSGSIIVSDEYSAGGGHGLYFSAGKGISSIDAINIVVGMTPDGQYVVGNSTSNGPVALWAAQTGNVTNITSAGWSNIAADAINGTTGSPTVVGDAYISGTDSRVGFRWKGGAITELATLGPGNFIYPRGVSTDGGTVVGVAGPSGNQQAFIWTDAGKLRTIVDELRARGLEPAVDFTLGAGSFLALSDDGKTIFGSESENTFWRVVLN